MTDNGTRTNTLAANERFGASGGQIPRHGNPPSDTKPRGR
jgi:hypothetical protein